MKFRHFLMLTNLLFDELPTHYNLFQKFINEFPTVFSVFSRLLMKFRSFDVV